MEDTFVLITQENCKWHMILTTQARRHMAMGIGWEAFLAQIKAFKCLANEEQDDTLQTCYTAQVYEHHAVWSALHDSPAWLPTWSAE